jgi:hypothetical protein
MRRLAPIFGPLDTGDLAGHFGDVAGETLVGCEGGVEGCGVGEGGEEEDFGYEVGVFVVEVGGEEFFCGGVVGVYFCFVVEEDAGGFSSQGDCMEV